jgi:hypothetical protein
VAYFRPPGGKPKWNQSAVESTLTNEKYKGDALLQKSYSVDFLTKWTASSPNSQGRTGFSPSSTSDSGTLFVDYATVYSENDVRFTFKDGTEIKA